MANAINEKVCESRFRAIQSLSPEIKDITSSKKFKVNFFAQKRKNCNVSGNLSLYDRLSVTRMRKEAKLQSKYKGTEIKEKNLFRFPSCSNVDIFVNCIICCAYAGCTLDLRHIALNTFNVEYVNERQELLLRFRKPRICVRLWKSGRMMCFGANDVDDCKKGFKYTVSRLKKISYNAEVRDMAVTYFAATFALGDRIDLIKLGELSKQFPKSLTYMYEPELGHGATIREKYANNLMTVYHTGSVTLNAVSVEDAEKLFYLVYPYLLFCQLIK